MKLILMLFTFLMVLFCAWGTVYELKHDQFELAALCGVCAIVNAGFLIRQTTL